MRIGWVGGLTRSEVHFTKIAADAGHELEFHTGEVTGHGAEALRRLVERSAVVIILTTINSHKGVQLAKRMAEKRNRPAMVMQRCGKGRFLDLLTRINQRTGSASPLSKTE